MQLVSTRSLVEERKQALEACRGTVSYAAFQLMACDCMRDLLQHVGQRAVFLDPLRDGPLWLAAKRLVSSGEARTGAVHNCFRLAGV